jgi:hypothetical protein
LRNESIEEIAKALRGGVDLETAIHYAEESVPEVYRWLEKGKTIADSLGEGELPDEENEPYYQLWLALKKARADAIVRNVAHVQQAARSGSWQAATWWLERHVPEMYGKRSAGNAPTQGQLPSG